MYVNQRRVASVSLTRMIPVHVIANSAASLGHPHIKASVTKASKMLTGMAGWWERGSSATHAKARFHAHINLLRKIGRLAAIALIVSVKRP